MFLNAIRIVSPSVEVALVELQSKLSCVGIASKPITSCRPVSSTSIGKSPSNEANDDVNIKFINRNPRNLELMNLARKRKGWRYQYPSVEFYHRAQFKATNRHTSGFVEHCSGKVIISASTKEFCIAKHLYSLSDYCAALNIGRVLARRCLEAGIYNMIILPPINEQDNNKFNAFQDAMLDGGITFAEAAEVVPAYEPGIDYDDEEALQELYARQGKVADISEVHAKIKEYRAKLHHSGSNWSVPPKPIHLTPVK